MQRKPSLAKKKNELERLKQGLVRYASKKKHGTGRPVKFAE